MALPPRLETLEDVAAAVQSGRVRRIGALLGAGVSVSAGIPDYRTSAGGLYNALPDLLSELSLQDAAERAMLEEDVTRVASRELFERNPRLFMEAKRPFLIGLYEGRWRPTYAHHALAALHKAGALSVVLTQNIDGFEAAAGLPGEAVRQVHGSLQDVACHFCAAPHSTAALLEHCRRQVKDVTGGSPTAPATTAPMLCQTCGRAGVRPKVIMYDEPLADDFDAEVDAALEGIDLLLVMGTSLTVAPVCHIPSRLPESCYRVVVNATHVGEDVGFRYGRGRDVLVLDDCDRAMHRLVEALGVCVDGGPPPPSAATGPSVGELPGVPMGRRIECVVRTPEDLGRVLVHSREATIKVPAADVDLTSHVTSGVPHTLRDFLATHVKEVARNMQMVMGMGGAAGVQAFLQQLEALAAPASMPWVLIVDDPEGEASLSHAASDTPETYRVTAFALTRRERMMMGRGD